MTFQTTYKPLHERTLSADDHVYGQIVTAFEDANDSIDHDSSVVVATSQSAPDCLEIIFHTTIDGHSYGCKQLVSIVALHDEPLAHAEYWKRQVEMMIQNTLERERETKPQRIAFDTRMV